MSKRMRKNDESGAAMVLVLTVMAALLAGGAMALMLQVNASKSSGLTASNRRALYCAESGLSAARNYVLQNKLLWDDMLGDADLTDNSPAGYPVASDIDDPADGIEDYQVLIRDDDDGDGDETKDANGRVFLVSTCTKYSAYQAQIVELVDVSATKVDPYASKGFGSTGAGSALDF